MLVVVSTRGPRHGRRDVGGFEHQRARRATGVAGVPDRFPAQSCFVPGKGAARRRLGGTRAQARQRGARSHRHRLAGSWPGAHRQQHLVLVV